MTFPSGGRSREAKKEMKINNHLLIIHFSLFRLFLPIYHSFLFSSLLFTVHTLLPINSFHFFFHFLYSLFILSFSVAIGLLLACGVCGVASMGVSYNFPSYDFPVEVINEQHRALLLHSSSFLSIHTLHFAC